MNSDKNSLEASRPNSGKQDDKQSENSDLPASRVPLTSLPPTSNESGKSHKVETKNNKSLHQKQKQQQPQKQQQGQPTQQQSNSASNRRNHQKSIGVGSNKPSENETNDSRHDSTKICTNLEEFSKRAQELKADINKALEKQADHQIFDQPKEVVQLKDNILKLSGLKPSDVVSDKNESGPASNDSAVAKSDVPGEVEEDLQSAMEHGAGNTDKVCHLVESNTTTENPTSKEQTGSSTEGQVVCSPSNTAQNSKDTESSQEKSQGYNESHANKADSSDVSKEDINRKLASQSSDSLLTQALDNLVLDSPESPKDGSLKNCKLKQNKQRSPIIVNGKNPKSDDSISKVFEPLNAKLDQDSKFIALKSSLQKHFLDAPHLLEPVCSKLVDMSEQNGQLVMNCEKYELENRKLMLVKQKLENLCRELQKSNNAIRIESLDLIKVEQGKAKEQTTKIQSTLSGVIKLFDENQQRNMSLRQENQELQGKLKSLLDHCDNWEKSVEAALRQRDIENRLLKTELAKANLLKNEEKEKFLGEKQELLQILSMMQEQQHRIEGQEAKLRSDLSSYASKYDECQAAISKGMSRFQIESKRMLKQIEKSKQDYKALFTKYESCNRRMIQLLEEKQTWDKRMNLSNKKIETLEKLCRALREQKQEGKSDTQKSNKNKSNKASKNLTNLTESSSAEIGSNETKDLIQDSELFTLIEEQERGDSEQLGEIDSTSAQNGTVSKNKEETNAKITC